MREVHRAREPTVCGINPQGHPSIPSPTPIFCSSPTICYHKPRHGARPVNNHLITQTKTWRETCQQPFDYTPKTWQEACHQQPFDYTPKTVRDLSPPIILSHSKTR